MNSEQTNHIHFNDGKTRCMLDISEASIFLGIKTSYLRYLRTKNCGPQAFRLGGKKGKIFFLIKDLEEWLNNNYKKDQHEHNISSN